MFSRYIVPVAVMIAISSVVLFAVNAVAGPKGPDRAVTEY